MLNKVLTRLHLRRQRPTFWQQNQITVMVAGSIIISLVLVVIAMDIYDKSGAAQLDLSRPGYKSVSSKVENTDMQDLSYSAGGPINQDAIDQFTKLYDQQAKKVQSVDAFSGDTLSDANLGIDAPTDDNSASGE